MLTELALTVTTPITASALLYARHLASRLRTDPLTGLANRAALERRFTGARRRDERVAVLLSDVNRFKQLNDAYGHRFGDLVLCEIASTLAQHARPGLLPVRLHGDEFAVLLTGLDAFTDPTQVADQIADSISQITVINGQPIEVALSIGAATGPASTGLPGLLARADAAMYQHKQASRIPVSR